MSSFYRKNGHIHRAMQLFRTEVVGLADSLTIS